MSQHIQKEMFPEKMALPELWMAEKFSEVGRIRQKLLGVHEFTYTKRIVVPKRRTTHATLYQAESGPKLLVTDTSNDKHFPDADAVLLREAEEERWLRHSELEKHSEELLGPDASRVRDSVRDSWSNQFFFKDVTKSGDGFGLRPPQIGALHGILAHWSISSEPATVVMPTGTGKTETMLSLLVAAQPRCMLVVVPSRALLRQTAAKFATLGILPSHEIISASARRPVVGIIERRLKTPTDLEIFDRCNVVIAVVNSVSQGTSVRFHGKIAEKCSHLVFDEAHHVGANSWNSLKAAFDTKKVLQFTATPFREDRTPLGGRFIYNYSLRSAQKDGYFKPISFAGVFEIDQQAADESIASKAVAQLRVDLKKYDHRLMARCRTISRAIEVAKIYERLAPDLKPIIVNSQEEAPEKKIEALREGEHKIVITVDMLKEGFDMPELKIAAMHDIFKSLAVTLQFAGRFPRVGSDSVGKPTIIANTGVTDMKASLQGLYDEDADWNRLLAEFSFEKVAEEERFEEFLHSSQDLSDGKISEDSIAGQLNKNSLVFKFNTFAYGDAKEFHPHKVHEALENQHRFLRAWQNADNNVVFYVTRLVQRPEWTKTKGVEDSVLNLFVAYFDEERGLLFIGSSYKSLNGHRRLAEALAGSAIRRIDDEEPYRVFEGIEHLVLNQVGLLKAGGARNLRYSMFSGSDVREAISKIQTGESTKSNIYGVGYREGRPVDIGCSRRGKIWCRDRGSLNGWMAWCDSLGTRLLNEKFDVSSIMENVLTPEPVAALPDKEPWFLEWPEKLLRKKEKSITLKNGEKLIPFHRALIDLKTYEADSNQFQFEVTTDDADSSKSEYVIEIKGENKSFEPRQISGPKFDIKVGSKSTSLLEYLQEYPPIISYIDHSALEGARLIDPAFEAPSFDGKRCHIRDWSGVNQNRESHWKDKIFNADSIQLRAMEWCQDDGFDVIFDDDGSNEIADIVALKEEEDLIVVRLLHCKYSGAESPGARVDDIIEVSSQAVKNYYWFWNMDRLVERMLKRHHERTQAGAGRFFKGTPMDLKKLLRLHREIRKTKNEIIVVQPGVLKRKMTEKMNHILGSADSFVQMRADCSLELWCS